MRDTGTELGYSEPGTVNMSVNSVELMIGEADFF